LQNAAHYNKKNAFTSIYTISKVKNSTQYLQTKL